MIQKQKRVVFTFHTTTDAMAMESLCKTRGLAGRLIPVPGAITADCGLAWCAEPPMEQPLLCVMERDNDILVRLIVKKTPGRFVYTAMRNQRTDFPVLLPKV